MTRVGPVPRGHYLLDCFAAIAMTGVEWPRMTRVCCESGLLRYTRNDKGGVVAHDKGGVRRA